VQDVPHIIVVAEQRNALHESVDGAGQLPCPSQLAARVAVLVPAGQLADRQDVVFGAKTQVALVPLQLPLHGAVPVQAVWFVRGWPVIKLQVPAVLAETLQNWHEPVQALLQQTPSAQKVFTHSRPLWHAWPLAFLAVHAPLTQKLLTQSASAVQRAGRHAVVVVGLHRTPPGQGAALAAGQVPAPLQKRCGVSWDTEHTGSAQLNVGAAKRQAPLPSQVPSRPQVVPPGAHFPFDDPPGLIGRQRPFAWSVSAAAHELQVAVHAVSQQMLPTQLPSAHSLPSVQVAPLALVGVQVPVAPLSAQ
jgi:hypothetical protein